MTPSSTKVAELAELVGGGRVAVLSGAGLSTESGIPDYRGPTGLSRKAEPMTYQRFVASAQARQRYWARSHVGWRQIGEARPNDGHRAVAELERRLHEANPDWDEAGGQVNPDGDAVLTDEQVAGFRTVDCTGCGGVLKPDVVFFGENVPKPRVDECFSVVGGARALLVLGSSLAIRSGLRFVTKAAALGLPIAIVNQGPTGGDADAVLILDAPLGATLTDLARRLTVAVGAQ